MGVELDEQACATRAAAGHLTVRADVSQYPAERFAGADGLIASPPCPSFSQNGKRGARGDEQRLRAHAIGCAREWSDPGDGWHDDRTRLVVEPLRWAHAIRPRWIALEQVPTVLPYWQSVTVALAGLGYSTWCGVVNAADYGVPQNRRRAVLLARCDGVAARAPRKVTASAQLSMGDALGWRGHVNTGLDWKKGGTRDDAQTIDCSRPAPTVTGKSGGQWHVVADDGSRRNATLDELAVLQSFPAGYPFAGDVKDRALQVGNAVPPRLAAAIVRELVDVP